MNEAALVGRRCESLVAREFWRSGRQVDEFCAIFLEDDHGNVWKLYLDDEDDTWKWDQEHELPTPGMSEGDFEFSYPSTDMFIRFPLRDQVIESLSENNLGTSARATILFSHGQALVLDYEYATERTTVSLEHVA
jgi:hypothetical protein